MNRRIIGVLFCGMVTTAFWFSASAQEKAEEEKLVMRDKLKAAEDVLAGLVTPDFELARQGAKRMQKIVKHRSWNVFTTDLYIQYSEELTRQSKQLVKAADDEDVDAMALAYMKVTFTCINCHRHVRDVKVANLEIPVLPVALLRQDLTQPETKLAFQETN